MPDKDNAARLQTDPHAWQDPTNVIDYVGNIATALSKIDPEGAAVYQKNAGQYIQSLKELDAWVSQQFAKIPPEKRKVITSHEAFEYFGARYGIRFFALQGFSTESEPSAKDMAKLVRQIRLERTRVVYVENMSSPKLLAQLSREAGVSLGPRLYSDALSGAQGKAPTYLKMVRYNAEQLMLGLQQN
jgi:zinc/manganese transport system substrate-binding protein